MGKVIKKMTLIAASLMIIAVPALAEEGRMGVMKNEMGVGVNKDECLLVAMNCGRDMDSIQQRITRIQKEIARGTSVYTADELRNLTDKLDDANHTLEVIVDGGA